MTSLLKLTEDERFLFHVSDEFKSIFNEVYSEFKFAAGYTLRDHWKQISSVDMEKFYIAPCEKPREELALYCQMMGHELFKLSPTLWADAKGFKPQKEKQLKRMAIALGSWLFNTHRLAANQNFKTYNKPLMIVQTGSENVWPLVHGIYWLFRHCGVPCETMDDGQIEVQYAGEPNFFNWREAPDGTKYAPTWGRKFFVLDFSNHCFSREVFRSFCSNVETQLSKWFYTRYPFIMVCNAFHLETQEYQHHTVAEFRL